MNIETKVMRKTYFIQVENTFINNPKYTPIEKLVFMSLCTYAGKNITCFPGQKGIAASLGVSLRTINSAIKSLKDKGGILTLEQYTQTNRKTVNTYFLADIDIDTGDFKRDSLDDYKELCSEPKKIKGK